MCARRRGDGGDAGRSPKFAPERSAAAAAEARRKIPARAPVPLATRAPLRSCARRVFRSRNGSRDETDLSVVCVLMSEHEKHGSENAARGAGEGSSHKREGFVRGRKNTRAETDGEVSIGIVLRYNSAMTVAVEYRRIHTHTHTRAHLNVYYVRRAVNNAHGIIAGCRIPRSSFSRTVISSSFFSRVRPRSGLRTCSHCVGKTTVVGTHVRATLRFSAKRYYVRK